MITVARARKGRPVVSPAGHRCVDRHSNLPYTYTRVTPPSHLHAMPTSSDNRRSSRTTSGSASGSRRVSELRALPRNVVRRLAAVAELRATRGSTTHTSRSGARGGPAVPCKVIGTTARPAGDPCGATGGPGTRSLRALTGKVGSTAREAGLGRYWGSTSASDSSVCAASVG